MKILFGIADHCVLQRNDENVCDVKLSGYTNSKAEIEAAVQGLDEEQIAEIKACVFKESNDKKYAYEFECTLEGIPAGGAYDVVICQAGESMHFSDVLVGDVYILAGQSNMEGIGRMDNKLTANDKVRAFYMDDRWSVAQDPLHTLDIAVDPVHSMLCGGECEKRNEDIGAGPGIAFGQKLYELTGVPQGLLACAHGGTSMSQWSPKNKDLSGDSLYGAMLRRVKKNGSAVKGMFWYQGCSDTDEMSSLLYYENMKAFISEVRKDTENEALPIVMVQIARQCTAQSTAHYWNTVQHNQYKLGLEAAKLSVVPAIDLEMDDFIHISGSSQNRLGARCANAMHLLNNPDFEHKEPIRLKTAEIIENSDNWNCKVALTYDNVIGELTSGGRPEGFFITKSPDKNDGNFIFRTELKGNTVILHTTETVMDMNNYYLHYGLGFQPYCNIIDAGDRPLPVIYSIALGKKRNFSVPCSFAWLSGEIAKDLDLSTADKLKSKLNEMCEAVDFWYFFLNVHNKFSESKDTRRRIVYSIPFEADLDCEVQLILGGVGQMSVYLDGEYMESAASDAAKPRPDQFGIPLRINKGVHVIHVEYSCEKGLPSGIFVRFDMGESGAKISWIK